MRELRVEPLMELRVEVGPAQQLGATPAGNRRIVPVTGGSFVGDHLEGMVLAGGGDWIVVRPDGVLRQDVRLTLRCDDGALILMTYQGLRHGSGEVMARLDRSEVVDPDEYYFRMAPMFETGDPRYEWINRVVSVGVGSREPNAASYSVYRVV